MYLMQSGAKFAATSSNITNCVNTNFCHGLYGLILVNVILAFVNR